MYEQKEETGAVGQWARASRGARGRRLEPVHSGARRGSPRPSVPTTPDDGSQRLAAARTVFVSDLHLGARAAKAQELDDVLARCQPETLYLVGDMIDLWRMRQRVHWPRAANRVVQRILAFADSGTRVVYIPGNHDDLMRDHVGTTFAGLEIMRNTDHTTAAGDRLWILHGDEYDLAIRHSRVAAMIGSTAYETLVELDLAYKRARRMLGLRPTSLAHAVKMGSKKVATALSNYERTLQQEAAARGYDGVICGHVHIPAITQPSRLGEPVYYNTGDCRESCTVLVEDPDGELRLLRYVDGNIRTLAVAGRRPTGHVLAA